MIFRYINAMCGHKYAHNELVGFYEDIKTMLSRELSGSKQVAVLPSTDYTKDIQQTDAMTKLVIHFDLAMVDTYQLVITVGVSNTVENLWEIEAAFVPSNGTKIMEGLQSRRIVGNEGIRSFNWVYELIEHNYDVLRSSVNGQLPDDYAHKVRTIQSVFDAAFDRAKELGIDLYIDAPVQPTIYMVPNTFTTIPGDEWEERKGMVKKNQLATLVYGKDKFSRIRPLEYIFVDKNYTGK